MNTKMDVQRHDLEKQYQEGDREIQKRQCGNSNVIWDPNTARADKDVYKVFEPAHHNLKFISSVVHTFQNND